ncbi:MAG TPA: ATP-dependent helicase [Cyanobacteria bacterium UBA8803]|nr:ATP-dependent helicase [Cyanobacteria bacterium UBA9273]HBL57859.1 ATP-dependent helicase [Cyanobacteria bacterium UBA8803]
MKILHGSWIPQPENTFIQTGTFYIWVETAARPKRKTQTQNAHPGQLTKEELSTFLVKELGIPETPYSQISDKITTQYFILPSSNNQPLPSLELTRYLEEEPPESADWLPWAIDCYPVTSIIRTTGFKYPQITPIIKLLRDLHFIALYNSREIQLGADLLFWYHYTQSFKAVIVKDQYIPALKYRELPPPQEKRKSKAKPKANPFEIYPAWQIISAQYEANIQSFIDAMPLACVAGHATPSATMAFYDKETLLRHFSECLLTEIVTNTPLTAAFDKKISNSLIYSCLYPEQTQSPWTTERALSDYKQWAAWQQNIGGAQETAAFYLCFQLQEATAENPHVWSIKFLATAKKDPSLKLALNEYWLLKTKDKKQVYTQFGEQFEKELLLNLGYAARMYPEIWRGLETDRPTGFALTLEEAFAFLKEKAWVLEDAGYKIIVPAWWTPLGRQRAKLRLKASPKKLKTPQTASKGYFSLDTIIQYQYELSIGGKAVTEQEWQQLVKAKTPLVQFRGQWIELDKTKMQQLLEFWQSHHQEMPEMTLLDFMKKATEEAEGIEIEHDDALTHMMQKLHDRSRLEPIENPIKLQGTLREYQKRGVSWLQYLEQLGLNGCLADDMGLGKSIQIIAQLIQERETSATVPPTLLIAPTSVVGNWQKEIEKFAPHLSTWVHHGSNRIKDEKEFQTASSKVDVVITSFTLARKDEKLLKTVIWQRLVLDEAQNIKNPQAAQTKAILKLQAKHRVALTGTPVENRLLDLWSIFNFLNPGYLGKEAQFRKNFEIPIQKDNNRMQSAVLKKLVEPLILRRVKTDKQIIKDLPDKIEHKQYCNLTKEQASLYEAVVKEVEAKLAEAEGIQRKGLILSTLMKLKQVCNHPAQFLQDGSEFSPERSHKLERLVEMIEEVNAEGESLLVFTQFTEVGSALERYLKHTLHYQTYYIHGGTSRDKREKAIAAFQDPDTEPAAFILSLKAGGVGITLTKANHVFHFDRWWNPAVEDQATDRAFRIGQKKNVFVHKFLALGTLEERIDQMIEDKKKLSSAIVGTDESWLTELDNERFKELIALNKTAILE